MLKFKNQKTTITRFLITATEPQKHILLPCCIYDRKHHFIVIQKLKRKRNNTRVFRRGGNEVSANRGFVDLCLQSKNKAPIIIDASVLTK